MLHRISMNIGCNQKYHLDCFNEQMEHTVAESKGEIEAFMQHKMYQIAQQALVDNPEKLFSSPVEVPGIESDKKRPKLKVNKEV